MARYGYARYTKHANAEQGANTRYRDHGSKDLEAKRMRAVWKTLRVASKTKLSMFDKISVQNLKPLLGLEQESEGREDDLAVKPPANAPAE